MKRILLSIIFSMAACVLSFSESYAMLQDNGALWVENDNGEMVWKKSVSAGTILESLNDVKNAVSLSGKKKEQPSDFAKVSYNGNEYWVKANRIAKGKVGVITTPCAIYKSASLSDFMTKTHFDAGTIIVENSPSIKICNIEMRKVQYFSTSYYAVKEVYVLESKASFNEEDMKAFILATKIKSVEDEDLKDELISSLESLNLNEKTLISVKTIAGLIEPEMPLSESTETAEGAGESNAEDASENAELSEQSEE